MENGRIEQMNELYLAYKPLLFSLAYQMTGTVTDAEDIVHDAYVQLQAVDWSKVQRPKAYMCSIVTHRCLDFMKSHRKQREVYVGPWLPEPLLMTPDDGPEDTAVRNETLTFAFLHLLDSLNPVERAVFLLREAFTYDYHDIAVILNKSEANCRKIYSRVKSSLQLSGSASIHNPERAEQYVHTFRKAAGSGQMEEFISLLANDVVLYSDGGGLARAATRPITERENVIRFLQGLFQKALASGLPLESHPIAMNGEHGTAILVAGRLSHVVCFRVREDVISSIYILRNPNKLQRAAAALGTSVLTDEDLMPMLQS